MMTLHDPEERARDATETERRRVVSDELSKQFRDDADERRGEANKLELARADRAAGVDRRLDRIDETLIRVLENIGRILPEVRDIVNGKLSESRAWVERELRLRDEREQREWDERDERLDRERRERNERVALQQHEPRLQILEKLEESNRFWRNTLVGMMSASIAIFVGLIIGTVTGVLPKMVMTYYLSPAAINPAPSVAAPLAPRLPVCKYTRAGRLLNAPCDDETERGRP